MAYKDPERQRAYGREWMKRNPEKARAAMRRWRSAHPAENNAHKREWYARHRDEIRLKHVAYRIGHPEVRRASWQNYRARKKSAGGTFSGMEWLALVERYGGRCGYCGAAGVLHADHRIPLSRGGMNSIDNIIPACNRCNARKAKLTEAEFRARLAEERDDDLQS